MKMNPDDRPSERPGSGEDSEPVSAAVTVVREVAATATRGHDGVLTESGEQLSTIPPQEGWPVDDELETVPPVLPGELLADRYLVEATFAEGGMGIVCLGRHTHLDQRVAIKFLKRSLSGRPVIVQRFLNEARALASLRSEHVVRVMDVGQLESGRPYLVMEHLDGIDLDGLLTRDGPLAVETAVEYAVQVCEAMSEAHALGIVHRDLKPENLFLWSGGPGKDVVKVLDFGLAKRLVSAVSATGPQDSMGSPCYMSPEQIVTPHLTDSRTDVWSLGVVLYRLLTDTLPFDGNDVAAVFSHVLHAAPPSLRDVLPGADQELDDIVRQCLEKSPADRYATMSALSDALVAYLAHRRSGIPAPATMPPVARPTLEIIDDTKIRIPGVHVRWPWILAALLAAAAAGVYQADRSGGIRALDYTVDAEGSSR
jgi:serine/threonine-protein kinase